MANIKSAIKKAVLWNKIPLEQRKKIKKALGINKNRLDLFNSKNIKIRVEKKSKKTIIKEVIRMETNLLDLFLKKLPVINADFTGIEVALYFSGKMGNIYQVEQWIEVFKALRKDKKFAIIVRDKEVFVWLSKNTDFTTIYVRTIGDLTELYEKSNFKVILYVNNAFKNFQSLMLGNALHVHINHGESDKVSTATNQSQAYNYVFIVSDAAYDKYRSNLIKADMKKYIKVGRPQLEHVEQIDRFPGIQEHQKVVLYAPTWEGTHDSMNFTSLNDYGMEFVDTILNDDNLYLVYKPHPNIGSRVAETKKINNEIIKKVKSHKNGVAVLSGDINSIYPHIDLAIFDNSAVAIDYLIMDKPMIITDMFHKIEQNETILTKPTITKAGKLFKKIDLDYILDVIYNEIENDPYREKREKVKKYFLGDYNYLQKESTKIFIKQIDTICKERDRLVKELKYYNNRKKPFLE